MTPWFLFTLVTLSSYRAWRLVGRDEFPVTAWPRRYAARRWGEESIAFYWFGCPWCAGAWVSAIVVVVVNVWYIPLPLPLLWWLSVSTVVGLIGAKE